MEAGWCLSEIRYSDQMLELTLKLTPIISSVHVED